MRTTSKEAAKGESELEKKLRSRSGIQAQVCLVVETGSLWTVC